MLGCGCPQAAKEMKDLEHQQMASENLRVRAGRMRDRRKAAVLLDEAEELERKSDSALAELDEQNEVSLIDADIWSQCCCSCLCCCHLWQIWWEMPQLLPLKKLACIDR